MGIWFSFSQKQEWTNFVELFWMCNERDQGTEVVYYEFMIKL